MSLEYGKSNNYVVVLSLIILIIAGGAGLYLYLKKEGFRLYFWHDTAPAKNSSYDLRGDPFRIRPQNTGIFSYSSYIADNHTNHRLPYGP
jgi:hypothetical protein